MSSTYFLSIYNSKSVDGDAYMAFGNNHGQHGGEQKGPDSGATNGDCCTSPKKCSFDVNVNININPANGHSEEHGSPFFEHWHSGGHPIWNVPSGMQVIGGGNGNSGLQVLIHRDLACGESSFVTITASSAAPLG